VVFCFVNNSKYKYQNKVKRMFYILKKQHNQGSEECSLLRMMILQLQDTCEVLKGDLATTQYEETSETMLI